MDERIMRRERERFELVQGRDGEEAARDWARKVVGAYRSAIEDPDHFASLPERRPQFEASIEALETLASDV